MSEAQIRIPRLIATSVVRGAEQGDSHGGVYLVDFAEQEVRQGFARGLCVIEDRILAAGSSPSTISLHDIDSGAAIGRVDFSTDICNAIHGLEVWPYE